MLIMKREEPGRRERFGIGQQMRNGILPFVIIGDIDPVTIHKEEQGNGERKPYQADDGGRNGFLPPGYGSRLGIRIRHNLLFAFDRQKPCREPTFRWIVYLERRRFLNVFSFSG